MPEKALTITRNYAAGFSPMIKTVASIRMNEKTARHGMFFLKP